MMRTGTTLVEGVVVDTNDPQQMGRIKVWCPGIDGETYSVEDLPWAAYVSPLAGHAFDRPAGAGAEVPSGPVAYGWWAIPKKGATVVIGFLYGDFNLRFYLGSYFPEHSNRSLPAGRNSASGPTTDTNMPLEPAAGNLREQFQGKLTAPEAQTRGAYERMAAQPRTIKDGTEGYQPDPASRDATELDPQTYCFVTPGRHSLIFQDHPSTSRVRLKTADGTQVILDDANERIYISTSRGRTWVELDADGRVHIYAADDIAVSSGGNIDLTARGNFSISAGGNINLSATGSILASACQRLGMTGDGGVNITSGQGMDLLASAALVASGSRIELNGPRAAAAECAAPTKVVPQHEPWQRAASRRPRNKNWKP